MQRYKWPKVPERERYCMYCRLGGTDNNLEGYIDNEEHILTKCNALTLESNRLYAKLETLLGGFLATKKRLLHYFAQLVL